MEYLERVEKTGAYRFRRGIPEHLRPFFPDRGTFWREHLNTKDETEARPRCLEVSTKVERLFQQAQARHDADRAEAAPTHAKLTIEAVTRLVADWKQAERSRRAQFVLERPVMPGWSDFLHECALNGIHAQRPVGEDPIAFMERIEARQAHIDELVRSITQSQGLLLAPDHPANAIMSDLVARAWIEVLDAEHRWRTNDHSDLPLGDVAAPADLQMERTQPAAFERRAPSQKVSGAASGPLFSSAFDEWTRLGKPAARTLMEARTALRLFTELHGDLPITEIGKPHARAFRDALARLPKHLSAKQKATPLPKLLKAGMPGDLRAPQTVNKTQSLEWRAQSGRKGGAFRRPAMEQSVQRAPRCRADR